MVVATAFVVDVEIVVFAVVLADVDCTLVGSAPVVVFVVGTVVVEVKEADVTIHIGEGQVLPCCGHQESYAGSLHQALTVQSKFLTQLLNSCLPSTSVDL